jgi:hypothetical protein
MIEMTDETTGGHESLALKEAIVGSAQDGLLATDQIRWLMVFFGITR